jgi:hypothetical protein
MSTFRSWLYKTMTFDGWMGIAEIIDALRIFPRVMLLGYLGWVIYFVDRILQFYFDLPSADKQSTQIAVFAGAVITIVTGIGAKVFDIYQQSSRDWAAYHNERRRFPTPQKVEETAVISKTTTGATPAP